jgi:hypothetical protein
MAFMEREVVYGEWVEVDGPDRNEWVPADLFSREQIVIPEIDGEAPIPGWLSDYTENRRAWSIKLTKGFGARLSAPGYLDCTDWAVFETEKEALEYLDEYYPEEEEEEEES